MLPTMVGASSIDGRSRLSAEHWRELKPGRSIRICRHDGTIESGHLLGFSEMMEESVEAVVLVEPISRLDEPDTTRIPLRDVRWIRTRSAYPVLLAFAVGLVVDYAVFSKILNDYGGIGD
jgi:hypothetical protein